jgi:hypothetical protein
MTANLKKSEENKRSRLFTGLSGIAGEYFVGAELSRRGYVASITLRNTRGIDILASNADATKSIGIQVKTNQGRGKEWVLNAKVEKDTATNLVFVFVRLNDLDAPEYYIVPRAVVAKYASENHSRWLSTPGRKGQAHKDNSMRKFADLGEQYLNKWEHLGLD